MSDGGEANTWRMRVRRGCIGADKAGPPGSDCEAARGWAERASEPRGELDREGIGLG